MRYDVVVVGGGHNGLVAAAYLARAGRSVLVLERLEALGGAAVSQRPFPGVDARLSRWSYLVSLLPRAIVDELGLDVRLARRRVSSYTPDPRVHAAHGLLVRADEPPAIEGWERFYGATTRLAQRVFPTLTEPLHSKAEMRALVDEDATWDALVEAPLGEIVSSTFPDDLVAGVVLTDALIGTFAAAGDVDLRQNRCFLYHVIGGGTGAWDVPVGGMGAVSGALERAAREAGAELRTGCEVLAVEPDGVRGAGVRFTDGSSEHQVHATHVLAGCAPAELQRLLGRATTQPGPEGAQLKVNLVLSRLPRLRDASVDPRDAFAGTFHVNETASQLQRAYDEAAGGALPSLPPCEVYCHSLTDPSILGPELQASGAQTMTLFGLHLPARLSQKEPRALFATAALEATLASLDSVLAEPIMDCVLRGPDGVPCVEVKTTADVEAELRMPGGNIFHRDLQWPWAESADDVGRWGVETDEPSILLCGAGARRGGGVSGIPGRNAAMALLSGPAPRTGS